MTPIQLVNKTGQAALMHGDAASLTNLSGQLPDMTWSGGYQQGHVSRDVYHKGTFTQEELAMLGRVATIGNHHAIVGVNREGQLVSAHPNISPAAASAMWNCPLINAQGASFGKPRRLPVTDTNSWIAPVFLQRT